MGGRAAATWAVDAPVFGTAVVGEGTAPGGAMIVLATPAGLRFLDGAGRTVARGEGPVAAVAADAERRVNYLDGRGHVHRLAADGTATPLAELAESASILVLAPRGRTLVGVGAVADVVPVTHRSADDWAIAVVVEPDVLEILDARGTPVWAARWDDPITQITAADLDDDGADEVVVAAGSRVLVLARGDDQIMHETK
jgi:hypothetical protein